MVSTSRTTSLTGTLTRLGFSDVARAAQLCGDKDLTAVVGEVQPSSALLPALRNHESDVDELTGIMFPTLVEKATAVTNAEGWAGGQLAAELADLDLFEAVRA